MSSSCGVLHGHSVDQEVCLRLSHPASNDDGYEWSRIGVLRLTEDPTSAILWGCLGGGLGVVASFGSLAAFLWIRWWRLKRVSSLQPTVAGMKRRYWGN